MTVRGRWNELAPAAALAACGATAVLAAAQALGVVAGGTFAAELRWHPGAGDLRPRTPAFGEASRPVGPLTALRGGVMQYDATGPERSDGEAPAVLVLPGDAAAKLHLNGLRLEAETLAGAAATFAVLRPDGFQEGPDRVEVVSPAGSVQVRPRAVLIGPAGALAGAAEALDRFELLARRSAALFGAAGAAAGFALAAARRDRRRLFTPSVLSLVMSAPAAAAEWSAAAGSSLIQVAGAAASALAAVMLLTLVRADAGKGGALAAAVARAGVLGLLVLSAGVILSTRAPEAGRLVIHWAGVATAGAAGLTALWLLFRDGGLRRDWTGLQRAIGVMGAASFVAGALAASGLAGASGWIAGGAFEAAAAAGALVLWCGLVWTRGFLDLEAALHQHAGLGQVVREQQARIEAQQAELEAEVRRRAVLEERERLSREIHDGVGGALVSLLLRARGGQLDDTALEEALQAALADVRLTVDALDHAPTTLDAALTTFRSRVAPAFAAAGAELDWRQDELGDRSFGEPGRLLNVLRVLQEACTNAVRHSGARTVRVSVGLAGPGDAIEIEVLDDGDGGRGHGGTGKGSGLANMAARAAAVGGTLDVGPGEAGGWRVRLVAPL